MQTAQTLYDDALQARHVLEMWLPYLLKWGFTRRELERLDAGHVFMLACRVTGKQTSSPPFTDAGERAALIEATRAQTL